MTTILLNIEKNSNDRSKTAGSFIGSVMETTGTFRFFWTDQDRRFLENSNNRTTPVSTNNVSLLSKGNSHKEIQDWWNPANKDLLLICILHLIRYLHNATCTFHLPARKENTERKEENEKKKNIDRKEENENENERERRRREQRKGKERKGAAAAKLWRQQRWCRRANPRD